MGSDFWQQHYGIRQPLQVTEPDINKLSPAQATAILVRWLGEGAETFASLPQMAEQLGTDWATRDPKGKDKGTPEGLIAARQLPGFVLQGLGGIGNFPIQLARGGLNSGADAAAKAWQYLTEPAGMHTDGAVSGAPGVQDDVTLTSKNRGQIPGSNMGIPSMESLGALFAPVEDLNLGRLQASPDLPPISLAGPQAEMMKYADMLGAPVDQSQVPPVPDYQAPATIDPELYAQLLAAQQAATPAEPDIEELKRQRIPAMLAAAAQGSLAGGGSFGAALAGAGGAGVSALQQFDRNLMDIQSEYDQAQKQHNLDTAKMALDLGRMETGEQQTIRDFENAIKDRQYGRMMDIYKENNERMRSKLKIMLESVGLSTDEILQNARRDEVNKASRDATALTNTQLRAREKETAYDAKNRRNERVGTVGAELIMAPFGGTRRGNMDYYSLRKEIATKKPREAAEMLMAYGLTNNDSSAVMTGLAKRIASANPEWLKKYVEENKIQGGWEPYKEGVVDQAAMFDPNGIASDTDTFSALMESKLEKQSYAVINQILKSQGLTGLETAGFITPEELEQLNLLFRLESIKR